MMSSRMSRFFSLRRNRAALRRLARGLIGNRRGVAAVEFAFVLPVMLLVYFGVVEVGQGVMIKRKVTNLTRAIGDLTAQTRSATVSDAEMNGIFDAAGTIMMPYTSGTVGMVVSSIVIDNARVAKLCWSSQPTGAIASPPDVSKLPDSVRIAKTSVIMATASYGFEPAIGYIMTGTIPISAGPFYMRARTGKTGGPQGIEQIERVGSPMC
jgi:Flp pilus assembly protein TadG